ncbi:RNA polymerase sigma-70 factor [Zobellia uliginosa]|uniref:RNA polymerase sigma-70 factor n=1 Tax=Zobellia uliginosa TaxID=143224 RepID=UPI0026E1A62D|nr:RNA polymerase sigma-70 factor [Zobellia uliginosa]MDO6519469.1 RNA polymerase sigma-70 factor [Zobellia uliginosa]
MSTLKIVEECDQVSVINLKLGCDVAYRELFDRYNKRLYYFALGYLKSPVEAEGVVQDVFAKIWEKKENLKPDNSFKAYIFTIAYNLIKKNFIRRGRVRDYLASEGVQRGFDLSTTDQLDYNFTMERLKNLVAKMPKRRQETFIKSRFEGLPVKDIAVEMGISPKTVENQITLALKYLRVHLNGTEEQRVLEM